MRIRFRQSGGFAGLTRGCEIDVDELDEAARTIFEKLLEGPRHTAKSSAARDVRTYTITVEAPGGIFDLSFDDLEVPQGAGPLLQALLRRAKPVKPK